MQTVVINEILDNGRILLERGWFKYVCGFKCKKVDSWYNYIFTPKYEVSIYSFNGLVVDTVSEDMGSSNLLLYVKDSGEAVEDNQVLLWRGELVEGSNITISF